MQVIGRIESVADDIQIKYHQEGPLKGQIQSVRGVLTTFAPTGVFEFTLDKQFISSGLVNDLTKLEGQKLVFPFARVDLDLDGGGRYRAWQLRKLPEPLESLINKPFSAPQNKPEQK